mgnify:CR=1 FL=1
MDATGTFDIGCTSMTPEDTMRRIDELHLQHPFAGARMLRDLLRRFAPDLTFDPMICADDVTAAKPAPEGLLTIQQRRPGKKLLYVGDTVDDARCARAAGVPFFGIAARTHTKRDELVRLFERESAVAIFENINEIEGSL